MVSAGGKIFPRDREVLGGSGLGLGLAQGQGLGMGPGKGPAQGQGLGLTSERSPVGLPCPIITHVEAN